MFNEDQFNTLKEPNVTAPIVSSINWFDVILCSRFEGLLISKFGWKTWKTPVGAALDHQLRKILHPPSSP